MTFFPETNLCARHCYISGIVQGVGFRFFVQLNAQRLGLSGYARNLFDGRVEVFLQGSEKKVQEMVCYLQQGPSWARVDRLEVQEGSPSDQWKQFSITG